MSNENKKEIKIALEDIDIIDGKVVITSPEIVEKIEGMNITGDSIDGEEGSNVLVVWF
ncbi:MULTISPECIES: hypothetical protein [unclassified Clostridium]|uniref:hypothetical protein n=1 Tax=unclassified Clostridium TaxID=2614128 RepID=UPI001EEA45D9|nr:MULTISPECIES: hypothetical protein [unclassified Clostridium]MDD7795187.1 hypothetical protein [Clostridium sp. 'White wine YQ']MDD7795188.1 hypothetical protein [Clostridium sp. 'White wine YQ']MDD7795189.1 hypothetical protein [Clostridium sp. 'White wine YQ']MDD7795190.1 hypothetical protein [Clostridium sp. 'White wine YQ']